MNPAYLYIYDQELSQPRYSKLVSRLESHLLTLGVKGRSVRLSPLKNLKEVVDEALKQGVKTIVAVGGDNTLSQLVNAAVHTSLIMGFIPTSNHSSMARYLGLPPLEAAADVLSARIIKRLDVGKINNGYFLDCIEITEPTQVNISLGNFSLSLDSGNRAAICNIGFSTPTSRGLVFSATDGLLDVYISPTNKKITPTRLSARRLKIYDLGQTVALVADGFNVTKTPATVEILPKKIKIIVGSDRLFD